MRFWFSLPRIAGIRPGVSFGREDFRQFQRTTQRVPGKPMMEGGFVYAIRGGTFIKIGVSSNPNIRLATLQTAAHCKLELCFVGACQTSGYEIEQEAHRLLAAHRTNGEWFDCSPELAGSAILGAADRLGQKICSVPPSMVNQIIAMSAGTEPQRPPLLNRIFWALITGVIRAIAAIIGMIGLLVGGFVLVWIFRGFGVD